MNEVDIKYRQKFMDFAIRVVQLKNYLNQVKHEYNMSDQLQRAGTAIGALQREASYAESDADFVHKLGIAQKECNETLYWLELLYRTEYLSQEQFDSLYADAQSLMRSLTSAIKTTKNKMNK